jgi:cation diffusion facilitator CzcD-associated flavoprotein CzcO
MSAGSTDVLIVGAGPTGLARAARIRWFRVGFRIVDRQVDRAPAGETVPTTRWRTPATCSRPGHSAESPLSQVKAGLDRCPV